MQDGFGELNLYPAARRRYWRLVIYGIAAVIFGVITWASFTSGDPHNTIYYATAVIGLAFLVQMMREIRKIFSGLPQARIDSAGLRLFYPSPLFWPWERIKGARENGGLVVVELREFGGVDQGEWNRKQVDLQTDMLECNGRDVVEAIKRGVRLFGSVP